MWACRSGVPAAQRSDWSVKEDTHQDSEHALRIIQHGTPNSDL
jgi:hypothetical protein